MNERQDRKMALFIYLTKDSKTYQFLIDEPQTPSLVRFPFRIYQQTQQNGFGLDTRRRKRHWRNRALFQIMCICIDSTAWNAFAEFYEDKTGLVILYCTPGVSVLVFKLHAVVLLNLYNHITWSLLNIHVIFAASCSRLIHHFST